MIRKIILCCFCVFFFTGCYDKTDIENIKSIALICVDDNSINYCSVTAEDGEKKFDFEVYTVDTTDLYYGIQKLCEITGKDVSLSHLEAMLFSSDLNFNAVKKNINSLLEGTNTHPKVMTAFFDGDFKTFFSMLDVPEYTSISKLTDKVLTNRNSLITKCSAMELSCAINFDISGESVPVIMVDDGKIKSSGSMFINNTDMVYVDDVTSKFVALIENKSGDTYVEWNNEHIPVNLKKIDLDANRETAKVKLIFDRSKVNNKEMFLEMVNHFESEFLKLKNNGFDVLKLGNYLNRKFLDIPKRNEFIKQYSGIAGWIKQINMDIEVDV